MEIFEVVERLTLLVIFLAFRIIVIIGSSLPYSIYQMYTVGRVPWTIVFKQKGLSLCIPKRLLYHPKLYMLDSVQASVFLMTLGDIG